MKALTVRQPWASLIIDGHKDVENRDWSTNHRGRIAIHAALALAPPDHLAHAANVISALHPNTKHRDIEVQTLPRGVVLGTVELVDVVMNYDSPWTMDTSFQWLLADPEVFEEPIPAKGSLSMWNWEQPE